MKVFEDFYFFKVIYDKNLKFIRVLIRIEEDLLPINASGDLPDPTIIDPNSLKIKTPFIKYYESQIDEEYWVQAIEFFNETDITDDVSSIEELLTLFGIEYKVQDGSLVLVLRKSLKPYREYLTFKALDYYEYIDSSKEKLEIVLKFPIVESLGIDSIKILE
jgi:hypothetical protein